jgi:tetratricopeptide (TPR) repeat protein
MRRVAAALLVCAACAAAPGGEPQPAQSRLAEAQARAGTLVRSGDTAGAARAYEEALRIATSLDDADAIAANAINLSVVYQWLGRAGEARKALATVVEDPRQPFSERRLLQAEVRRAIVELSLGEHASAAAMAERAAQRCASGCEYAATILNVQAQLALARGDAEAAAAQAQAALERARAKSDRAESANALRNLGRAERLRRDPARARSLLEQALELDRGLADSRKVLADLTELSRAAAEAGDAQAARGYGERALAVNRAFNNAAGIADMEARLRQP